MAENANMYELTYIINSVLKDSQIQQHVDRVRSLIEDEGGQVVEVDEWGSQRMAYQIDGKRSGYYVNVYFQAPGEVIARVERALNLEDDILRYLTLRMDATMLRHYEGKPRVTSEASEESS